MKKIRLIPCLCLGFAVAAACMSAGTVVAAEEKEEGEIRVEPRPSEMAKLATKDLLLGIVKAGDALIAVGDRGNILRRSAEGGEWEQRKSPVHAALTAVSFSDQNNGWAVGHDVAIIHTTDGGKTWALEHFDPGTGQPLLDVLAIDSQRAIAIGAYALFLHTADAGKTWSQVEAEPMREDGLHLSSLIRLGDGRFFMAGEIGLIGVSEDGVDWQRLEAPYEGSFFGALPRGAKGALVFGLRGNVLYTDDVSSGTWSPIDIGSVQSLFGGSRLDDGRAVLVGSDGEIVFIDQAGQVKRSRHRQDASGNSSGTLSGVVAASGRLQIVGEAGLGDAPLAK